MPHKSKRIVAGSSRVEGRMSFSVPAKFRIQAATEGSSTESGAPLGDQAGLDSGQPAINPNKETGHDAGGKPGKPPLPKFALSFYGGGKMRVGGYKMPVVIDCAGVRCASPRFPIYANHIDETTSGKDIVEQLVGQTDGPCSVVNGCELSACGSVTGQSETVKNMMTHANNGFEWQASIDAMPTKGHVVAEGDEEEINGSLIAGPAFVADESVLANVAIVPLGADTMTSARFAAQSAARSSNMEFEAWLKAEYDMSTAEFAALKTAKPGQHAKIEARWSKLGNVAGAAAGAADGSARIAQPQSGGSIRAAADGADEDPLGRKRRATESRRVAALDQLQEQYKRVEVIVDGKPITAGAYIAQSIEDGLEPDTVELTLLRASRKPHESGKGILAGVPGAPGSGPMIGSDFEGMITAANIGMCPEQSPSRGGRHPYENNDIPSPIAANWDASCRTVEAMAIIAGNNRKQPRGMPGNQSGESWSEALAKDSQYGPKCVEMAEGLARRHGYGMGPIMLMRMGARFHGMRELPYDKGACVKALLGNRTNKIVAEFTTFTLPVLLSNIMNKFLLDGYDAVDPEYCFGAGPAWQRVFRRGPVNDFKPHFRARLIGNFRPQALGRGGEIQQATLGEQSYEIQAAVKALMSGFSYQDLINDDQSSLSTIPTLAGVGCGEQVARDAWSTWLANKQSDGSTAFFSATDRLGTKDIAALNAFAKNLLGSNGLGATAATAMTAMTAAYNQFIAQVKPNGSPFGAVPSIALVPIAGALIAKSVYQSTELIPALATTTGSATGMGNKNTLGGMLLPVSSAILSDPTITGYSTTSWYVATQPTAVAYAAEAAFLNGQEAPIVERDEMSFDRLGIAFRWWLSYGFAMAEPRAALQCTT